MKAIQIRNWDQWFENHESRKLKRMMWFSMPNKHDGKGFGRLARHKNAVQLLCGWTLLLQVASKQPKRGLLVDEDGPLSIDDLENMTRFPALVFEKTIEVLSGRDIGWIELIDCPESITTSGKDPAEIIVQLDGKRDNIPTDREKVPAAGRKRGHREGKGIEGNGREETPLAPLAGSDLDFSLFPRELNTAAFLSKWAEYVTYRKNNRLRPLKSASIDKRFSEFAKWGEPVAIEAINNTIKHGYQGIFHPDKTNENTRSGNARGRHFRPTGRPIPSTAPGLL